MLLKTFLDSKSKFAIIPIFNEEKYIKDVVLTTLKYVDYIILVDDGSTDNSVQNIPDDKRIIIEKIAFNTGKGFALNAGIRKAITMGASLVVTLDGDAQHPPEHIPEFFDKLNEFDVIIGARKRTPGVMPVQRIISNFLTSFLLSFKVGCFVKDSQSGFRGYRTEHLIEILPVNKGFMAETEIIVNALRKGLRLGYTPIPTIYGDQKSKMTPVKSILDFLKLLFLK